MDLENCILGRRSIRRFKAGPVPDEVIMTGLKLANAAPSAGNLQAREFIIVRDPDRKKLLSEAALDQQEPTMADVVVVFCANLDRMSSYGKRGREFYILQDVGASVQNFLLYIHSQGLGAVWIGAFNDTKVSEVLELPHVIKPVAIVPVGIPAEVPKNPEKRSLDEMTHREKWRD